MKALLPDELWAKIEPLLPQPKRRRFHHPRPQALGPPPSSHRHPFRSANRNPLERLAKRVGVGFGKPLPTVPPEVASGGRVDPPLHPLVGRVGRCRQDQLVASGGRFVECSSLGRGHQDRQKSYGSWAFGVQASRSHGEPRHPVGARSPRPPMCPMSSRCRTLWMRFPRFAPSGVAVANAVRRNCMGTVRMTRTRTAGECVGEKSSRDSLVETRLTAVVWASIAGRMNVSSPGCMAIDVWC